MKDERLTCACCGEERQEARLECVKCGADPTQRHMRAVADCERLQAECDHLRRALEWAVHNIESCVYRDGRECAVVESGEENEDCFDGICFEHRMQAALKAAEEAPDDPVDA